jgi:hypothetical protein
MKIGVNIAAQTPHTRLITMIVLGAVVAPACSMRRPSDDPALVWPMSL